jgi:uncharacterized membrane protein
MRLVRLLVLVGALAASGAIEAFAAPTTTLQYTGNLFTAFSGPSYDTADRVTITLVLSSPLTPNYAGGPGAPIDVAPLIVAYTFDDGVQTFTEANSSFYDGDVYTTDANGLPTGWNLYVTPDGSISPPLISSRTSTPRDIGEVVGVGAGWGLDFSNGTWAIAVPPPAEISFTTLGTLPGGTETDGRGVSADGSTVVGTGTSACCEAFRWDEGSGLVGLGDLPGGGFVSYAHGTSADGSFVVGSGRVPAPGQDEAYRWDSGSGLVGLGFVPGGSGYSVALDTSDDGSKVVGISNAGGLDYVAFLWTSPGPMVSLGDFGGGAVSSTANAISGDGTTVVGRGETASADLAFIWTAGTGLNSLGTLAGCSDSEAYDVSQDGSVVVGYACEPFIWDAANGMVGLGSLTGSSASFHRAFGVSADGSVVVGRGYDNGFTAFVWDARNGMRRIDDLLTAGGVDLDGWTLEWAYSVSADGQTIAGTATKNGNDQAFVAVLPRPDVIDFEPATPGTTIPPDYYEDGFTLQWLGPLGDSQQIVDFAGNNVLTDSDPLNFSGAGSTLEFTATPGVAFDLISLDVADLTNNPAGGGGSPGTGSRIEIIADGQTFVFLPTSSTFTTETLDLTGLTTLSINIVSAASGADDFAVDDVVLVRRQVTPVPVLGVLGQLGLALSLAGAGLAGARWRRV